MVVVAAVPVAFRKVKFCSVEEPVESRLLNVPRPVAVSVPFTVDEAEEMIPPRKYDSPDDVAAFQSRFTKCEVVEAKIPFCAQSGEEVAAVVTL